jgi:hypothetical protein
MRDVDLQALVLSLLGLTAGRHHGWARESVARSKILVSVSGHTVSRKYGR